MTAKLTTQLRLAAAWVILVSLAVLPISAVRAAAAAATDAPSTDQQANGALQEVVVTARKREEPLQRVPISIAAVTAADIEQRSQVNLEQVASSTPNVAFFNASSGTNTALVFIRGIGQTDPLVTNDPGVGIYVDGVYFGRMQGVNVDTMDVSRIEILRGPQGTLFGKNTIGGAINVVTTEPSLQSTTGYGELTAGSYHRGDAIARLSTPLINDQLAVSLSLGSRNQSGYGTRLIDGQGMGNTKELDGRFEVRYKANDGLEFLLAADGTHVNEHQGDQTLLAVNTASPLVGLLNLISNPPYDSRWLTNNDFTSYATGRNFNQADLWGTSLTASWNTGPVTVKSITAYRRNNTDIGTDPDGSPLVLIDQGDRVQQSQFSQELQFSGLSFEGRLNWVGGLYYFHERVSESVIDDVFTGLDVPPFNLDASFTTNVAADNSSSAAYAQGTYAFTDQFHVTLGVRETYEDKTGSVYRYAHRSGDATIIPFTQKSATWNSFTPRVSFEYQFTPEVMGYVSAASGFKSGGFNGRANNAAGLVPYNPEKAWTYELGVRSEMLDRRVRVNATAYYTDYKDIQYTLIEASAGGQPNIVVGNAAAARIDGGELELNVIPVQNFTLSASAGLTDAKYTSTAPGAQVTTATPFLDTPKWTGTASGQYVFVLPKELELVAFADWSYRGLVYFSVPVTPYVTQGGYSIVDARLTLRSPQQGWSVALFGTNLTDKHYMTGASDVTPVLGFASGFWAPPREWGATVEYRF